MIRLKNINKSFDTEGGSIYVLKNINCDIRRGEMFAVTGRSGSGKSTLLHIMSGLTKPTSGEVTVDGEDISKFNEKQTAKFRNEKIGFVFQSFYLEPSLSAWENVALPLMPKKIKFKERKEIALNALERVGLSDRTEHKPSQLSGGEMQRVCIARALINNPSVIFADEPTGNLDKANGKKIIDTLRALTKNQRTIVLVTHDPNDAEVCDRKICLIDGEITSDVGEKYNAFR